MAEMFARLKRKAIDEKSGVAGVVGVAEPSRYVLKALELRQLRPLRPAKGKEGKHVFCGVMDGVTDQPEPNDEAIDERAALCASAIPAPFLDAWARLNHRKPLRISDTEWRQALDDGGRFFDAWGDWAEEWRWTPDELLATPRTDFEGGLIWRLAGEPLQSFGPEAARLGDGRIVWRDALDP